MGWGGKVQLWACVELAWRTQGIVEVVMIRANGGGQGV